MTANVTAAALGIGLALSIAAAHATEQTCPCHAPAERMPLASAEAMARKLGYDTFLVQPNGGFWAIDTTKDGSRWTIMLAPRTGAVVRQGQT